MFSHATFMVIGVSSDINNMRLAQLANSKTEVFKID